MKKIKECIVQSFYPSDKGGSGYFTQKFCTERTVATGKEAYDFPVIRYAEVLLNYAEAVFERDGNISNDDLKSRLIWFGKELIRTCLI